jgi:hypothetical protein
VDAKLSAPSSALLVRFQVDRQPFAEDSFKELAEISPETLSPKRVRKELGA